MTNPGSTPERSDNLKSLIIKGVIGAVTLAGTTAIPLVINRTLSPEPSPSPAAASPAASPSVQASPVVQPAQVQSGAVTAVDEGTLTPVESNEPGKKKGKKKKD